MSECTYTAIGLMSGTSMDGVDAAILRTDGADFVEAGPWLSVPYPDHTRGEIRSLLGARSATEQSRSVERAITVRHIDAVKSLLSESGLTIYEIDIIGFHGQTLTHRPRERFTWQIGDAPLLARSLGTSVVADFRSADVGSGGQGAPLAPLFHRAIASSLDVPIAIVNVGGVANVTWIGADSLLAFDTGPGNALIDDWVHRHGAGSFDDNGRLAASGLADPGVLAELLSDPFFAAPPPKSIDRQDFRLASVEGLGLEDGAATLVGLTVGAIMSARQHFPETPRRWLVTGGGRHNGYLMALLKAGLDARVDPIEAVGWQGDALEAQAFAYLAVRSLLGLPLSLPSTTGVAVPATGGVLFRGVS